MATNENRDEARRERAGAKAYETHRLTHSKKMPNPNCRWCQVERPNHG